MLRSKTKDQSPKIKDHSVDELLSVSLVPAGQLRIIDYDDSDPYEFFMLHFSKNVIPRKSELRDH